MNRIGKLLAKYLVGAILPYFIYSWLLLSVILFVQQASRFADIFFNLNIPGSLIWQLAFALIPNVIAFTCPMAILVGTIIGLARMQNDSELVAIRAAGVGTFQLMIPIAVLGVLLSAFAFLVNLRGVPLAAALVRNIALQTAIRKLESPIEPGVFNTEVAGYTIYVKGGDVETGRWENIFIHADDAASGVTRIVTSSSGRIDVADQASELVLENATVTSIPRRTDAPKFVSENVGEIRFAVKTKRGELIEKLTTSSGAPEELGLSQLAEYASSKDGRERIEANILWYRRIVLSITPLLFCLLGSAMMLRLNRAGRGAAIALAFAGLVGYYFIAFGGEQLARTGVLPPVISAVLAPTATVLFIVYLSLARRRATKRSRLRDAFAELLEKLKPEKASRLNGRNFFVDLTTGLRDFDIALNLVKFFCFAILFLAAIFVIFTAFELWKFAGTIDGGFALLSRYLFFLLPFVYLQLVPSATLIAVLATYVIKSRNNEIVTWISAGQSVYRLLLPALVLAVLIGAGNFGVQEWLAPSANVRQDDLRTQLRRGGVLAKSSNRFWVANDRRIYSFSIPPQEEGASRRTDTAQHPAQSGTRDGNANDTSATYRPASDNETARSSGTEEGQSHIVPASDNVTRVPCTFCVSEVVIYEFSQEIGKLQTIYRGNSAKWSEDGVLNLEGDIERSVVAGGAIRTTKEAGAELVEEVNPFSGIHGKPSHLTITDLKARIGQSESEAERNTFSVAVQKRYSVLLAPLVIVLFAAPFSMSLGRKGKVLSVGYAVGCWLLFVGVTTLFAQFGDAGSLPSGIAVWAPLIAFSMLGVYFMSKVRT